MSGYRARISSAFCVPDRPHASVQLADPALGRAQPHQLVVVRLADPEPCAVVAQHLEPDDVVNGLAGHHRVHAARVVSDHAAERAVRVGCRIRAEGAVMGLGGVAELVEDDPRADACPPLVVAELEQLVVELRVVEDDRDVACLPGEARAAAAREHGDIVGAADVDGRHHVIGVARHDDPDRDLAVVGRVGAVQRPAAGVEPHLATDGIEEVHGEPLDIGGQGRGFPGGAGAPAREVDESIAPGRPIPRRQHADFHTCHRSASPSRISRPRPGRARSGAVQPSTTTGVPSNRRRSTRS